MPIEELLALYNCVTPTIQTFTSSGSSRRRSKTSRNAGNDKTLMPPPDAPQPETSTSETVDKIGEEATQADIKPDVVVKKEVPNEQDNTVSDTAPTAEDTVNIKQEPQDTSTDDRPNTMTNETNDVNDNCQANKTESNSPGDIPATKGVSAAT